MRLGGECCGCILWGYTYAIATTCSTQSGKDAGQMSKGGGFTSDQQTGRYIVLLPF